jgi:hypothetical protein
LHNVYVILFTGENICAGECRLFNDDSSCSVDDSSLFASSTLFLVVSSEAAMRYKKETPFTVSRYEK